MQLMHLFLYSTWIQIDSNADLSRYRVFYSSVYLCAQSRQYMTYTRDTLFSGNCRSSIQFSSSENLFVCQFMAPMLSLLKMLLSLSGRRIWRACQVGAAAQQHSNLNEA